MLMSAMRNLRTPRTRRRLIDDPGLRIVGHATSTAGMEAGGGNASSVAINLIIRDSIPSLFNFF